MSTDRPIWSMMMKINLVVILLQSNCVVESTISLPRKEQHIIGAKRNGANCRCIYVPGLLPSSFSLHCDILGLTLSIVREILVINIRLAFIEQWTDTKRGFS